MNANNINILSMIDIIRFTKHIKNEQKTMITQIYDELTKLKNKKINDYLLKIKDVCKKDQILISDKKIIVDAYEMIKQIIENDGSSSSKTSTKLKKEETTKIKVKSKNEDEDEDEENEDEEDEENEDEEDEENEDNEDNEEEEEEEKEKEIIKEVEKKKLNKNEKKEKIEKTAKTEKTAKNEKTANNMVKEITKKKTIEFPTKPKGEKKKILKKTDNLDKSFIEEYDEIYLFLKKELTKMIFGLNTREIKINISNFEDVYENGLFKEMNECALNIKKKNNLVVVNATGQAITEILERSKISYSENLFIYDDGEVVLKKRPNKKTEPKKKGTTLDLVVPALSDGSNIKDSKCHMIFFNHRKLKKILEFDLNTKIHYVSRYPLKNKINNVNYVSINEDAKTFTSLVFHINS